MPNSAPSPRPRLYPVEVSRVASLSPHLTRITVTGRGLGDYVDAGPDQRFKLLLPLPGQDRPVLPDGPDWFATFRRLPEHERPIMRTYTVRHIRRAAAELDIDFVLHGDGDAGPATAWAAHARVGDRCAISAAKAEYAPPAGTEWLLIAGDETALPAIGAILERRPARLPAQVWIEVADAAERQPLQVDEDVALTWLYRDDARASLPDAVRAASLPPGTPYAWLAAEADAVTALRRHLVEERGVPRDRLTFSGYWRLGVSIEDEHRHTAQAAAG